MKLNENNNLKRILNDKKLKEEFAEIFSQKGCNKSVVCRFIKEKKKFFFHFYLF